MYFKQMASGVWLDSPVGVEVNKRNLIKAMERWCSQLRRVHEKKIAIEQRDTYINIAFWTGAVYW